MTTARIHHVPDISCQHCVDAITREVAAVDGVVSVDVDLEAKTVAVTGGDDAVVLGAIEQAGYAVA